jgi:hypothetical protein
MYYYEKSINLQSCSFIFLCWLTCGNSLTRYVVTSANIFYGHDQTSWFSPLPHPPPAPAGPLLDSLVVVP